MLLGSSLTISGNGTILCNTNNQVIHCSDLANTSYLTISDKPTLKSTGIVLDFLGNGKLTINGGYLNSESGYTLRKSGSGNMDINNTYIYTPVRNECALWETGSGPVTINNSYIGNGTENKIIHSTQTDPNVCVGFSTAQDITITNTWIMAGPYSGSAISKSKGGNITFNGSCRIYANNINKKR